MIFRFFKQINDNIRRKIRRAFLADPEKMPQRYATIMAAVVLISIIVTYNVLYEKETRKQG